MDLYKRCPVRTKEGKYLTFRTEKNGPKQLVAAEFQDKQAPVLEIYEKVTTTEIAISFKYDGYSLKVVGTDLKVEKTCSFTDDHWFKKINLGGDHFGLQTMNEYYLACETDNTVCLLPNQTDFSVQCGEALTTSSPSPCTT